MGVGFPVINTSGVNLKQSHHGPKNLNPDLSIDDARSEL